jgi:hypothetical protein
MHKSLPLLPKYHLFVLSLSSSEQHLFQNGLTYQVIMSFHECGGNVGDECYYPIPAWASDVAKSNDLLYKDKHNGDSFTLSH